MLDYQRNLVYILLRDLFFHFIGYRFTYVSETEQDEDENFDFKRADSYDRFCRRGSVEDATVEKGQLAEQDVAGIIGISGIMQIMILRYHQSGIFHKIFSKMKASLPVIIM